MLEKLNRVYEAIQHLEGVPITRNNTVLLSDIFFQIEDIAKTIQRNGQGIAEETPAVPVPETESEVDGECSK